MTGQDSSEHFYAKVKVAAEGGYRWQLYTEWNGIERRVDRYGHTMVLGDADSETSGQAWTRWGAKLDAWFALRTLRRYRRRGGPEVVRG